MLGSLSVVLLEASLAFVMPEQHSGNTAGQKPVLSNVN